MMAGLLKPRILLINPSAEESLGVLEGPLQAAGARVDEYAAKEVVDLMVAGEPSETAKVVLSSELPRTARGYDALVVLGSPLGVLTGEGEKEADQTPKETILACEDLIRNFTRANKPVLGLCLGSQLIARAFGGKAATLPKDAEHTALPTPLQAGGPGTAPSRELGLEFGWQAQKFTPAAVHDPIVGKALQAWKGVDAGDGSAMSSDPKFKQWHSDFFELPPGAVPLSTRETCRSQAFRVGQCTYGFQYHIEVGKELAEEWCVPSPPIRSFSRAHPALRLAVLCCPCSMIALVTDLAWLGSARLGSALWLHLASLDLSMIALAAQCLCRRYRDYAQGNDSFVEGDSRPPLTEVEQSAFNASLQMDVASGAVARAEAFAEAVMAGLLAKAKANALATALRAAAGVTALAAIALALASARRRR